MVTKMTKFKTAIVQYDTKLPDVEYNSRLAERLIRDSKANGAELILHPNCCGELPPRLNELACRAMENMVYVAMANPPGPGMGNSCAYDPMVFLDGKVHDNTIFVGGELDETIYYVDFDLDELRRYRQNEDIGKYRRPNAYKRIRGLE